MSFKLGTGQFESVCSAKKTDTTDASTKQEPGWIEKIEHRLKSLVGEKIVETTNTIARRLTGEPGFAPVELVTYAISQALAKNNVITNFNPSFMKGVEGEGFSVSEASAFDCLESEISSNINQRVEKHGQGDHQKDWHWNAKMSHETNTLYVPICHAAFDYQGTEYHVWIDGIGEAEIRADKLPEDKGRKKLIYLGFLPAGVAIIGGSVVTALLLAGYAAIRRHNIVGYSKKIRDSLLTQIHASSSTIKEITSEERDKLARSFQRPEKPFFAKTHKDKVVLPVLSLLALISWFFPPDTADTNNSKKIQQAKTVVAQAPVAAPVPTPPAVIQPKNTSAVGAASAPAAEWVKVGESKDGDIALYADSASIHKNGNKAAIWGVIDFKTEQINTISGKPYLSHKQQYEFDCKDHKQRLLNIFSFHYGKMGDGEVTYRSASNSVPTEWSPVTLGSGSDGMLKIACKD